MSGRIIQGVRVDSRGRRQGRRAERARCGVAALRSPLTALIVALSLIVQLIAIPYRQALAAPAQPVADTAAIAADLKATFGDVAFLCVQADDKGAPSPLAPAGHCGDQCPLCRFFAQVAALIPPHCPAVPQRLGAPRRTSGAAPRLAVFDACPSPANRARAPPLAV
jgi:hypothetical protein